MEETTETIEEEEEKTCDACHKSVNTEYECKNCGIYWCKTPTCLQKFYRHKCILGYCNNCNCFDLDAIDEGYNTILCHYCTAYYDYGRQCDVCGEHIENRDQFHICTECRARTCLDCTSGCGICERCLCPHCELGSELCCYCEDLSDLPIFERPCKRALIIEQEEKKRIKEVLETALGYKIQPNSQLSYALCGYNSEFNAISMLLKTHAGFLARLIPYCRYLREYTCSTDFFLCLDVRPQPHRLFIERFLDYLEDNRTTFIDHVNFMMYNSESDFIAPKVWPWRMKRLRGALRAAVHLIMFYKSFLQRNLAPGGKRMREVEVDFKKKSQMQKLS